VSEILTKPKGRKAMRQQKKQDAVLVIDDVSPATYFPMPYDGQFVSGESNEPTEFLMSEELSRLGNALIEQRGCFSDLVHCRVLFLFKKKGGNNKGKMKLGQCQKPTGLLSYFSNTDFVIWVAADNCIGFTYWQIEALLFHELKHASVDYDEKGEKKLAVEGHDLEAFVDEVRLYGAWKADIEQMKKAFQPTLFDTKKAVEEFADKLEEGDSLTVVKPDGKRVTITGTGRKTKSKIQKVLNPPL
jgi:hypothetical protein